MSDRTVTFVNILDVDPDRQQPLVDLLTHGAEEVIRCRPGFISVTLLASRDGRRVVNLARWASAEAARAAQADPDAAEYGARVAAMATGTAGLYMVAAEVH